MTSPWNTKKQRTRVYVDEMVDKDGNIWGPRCLARPGDHGRELDNLSSATMKHGRNKHPLHRRVFAWKWRVRKQERNASQENEMNTWWPLWMDPTSRPLAAR